MCTLQTYNPTESSCPEFDNTHFDIFRYIDTSIYRNMFRSWQSNRQLHIRWELHIFAAKWRTGTQITKYCIVKSFNTHYLLCVMLFQVISCDCTCPSLLVISKKKYLFKFLDSWNERLEGHELHDLHEITWIAWTKLALNDGQSKGTVGSTYLFLWAHGMPASY
jgi:hypothetical protein